MEEVNYSYDIGILTLSDANQFVEDGKNVEFQIKQKTQSNLTLFYNKLIKIKQEKEDLRDQKDDENQIFDFQRSAYDIDLPLRLTVFPRHKLAPKKDQYQTKWEKFAQEKGIEKRKRSSKVFDEATNQYVARWGSKSSKSQIENNLPIMEVKQGQDPFKDPFQKNKLEKRLKIAKQELQQSKNSLAKRGLKAEVREEKKNPKKKDKQFKVRESPKLLKEKKDNTQRLSVAQSSTQSQGRFDKKNKNEQVLKKPVKKNIPHFKDSSAEQSRYLDILDQVHKKQKI